MTGPFTTSQPLAPGIGLVDRANPTFNNVTLSGYLQESFADNLTAVVGGTQTTGLLLTAELNRITTSTSTNTDAVVLPPSVAGLTIYIANHSSFGIKVLGSGTDLIDDVATATGVIQMTGSVSIYTCYTAGNWYVEGIGTGYAGSLPTMSFTNNQTPTTNPLTQTSATAAVAITTAIWRANSNASQGGGSYILPTAIPGLQIQFLNPSSFAMNVFAQISTDSIQGKNAAPATVFLVQGSSAATFISAQSTSWHVSASA